MRHQSFQKMISNPVNCPCQNQLLQHVQRPSPVPSATPFCESQALLEVELCKKEFILTVTCNEKVLMEDNISIHQRKDLFFHCYSYHAIRMLSLGISKRNMDATLLIRYLLIIWCFNILNGKDNINYSCIYGGHSYYYSCMLQKNQFLGKKRLRIC